MANVKRFKDMEVFQSEQQGRDYAKSLRLRSYSLTLAAPCWGGAWVLWYNRPRIRKAAR
jgi:hypothetical protein